MEIVGISINLAEFDYTKICTSIINQTASKVMLVFFVYYIELVSRLSLVDAGFPGRKVILILSYRLLVIGILVPRTFVGRTLAGRTLVVRICVLLVCFNGGAPV
jgi:hypothetical protein